MKTDPVSNTLTQQLDELADTRLTSLSDSANLQTLARTLLEHETRRMEIKLGDNHPRTQQLRARLDNARTQIDALVEDRERSQIQILSVADDNALVHGIVTDRDRRGVAGLMVCFTDNNSRPIPRVGEPVTNDSGYFAFDLSPADIDRLNEQYPDGVFLAVFSGDGRTLLERQTKPLNLTPKARVFVEFQIDRRTTFEQDNGEPPTDPATVSVPDVLGQTETDAASVLRKARLKVGKRTTKPVDDPDHADRVLGQNPQAGAVVDVGSAVDLVIGAATVSVPSVLGLTQDAARETLVKFNLTLGRVSLQPVQDPDRIGRVLKQEPEAGTQVAPGTAVNVTIGVRRVGMPQLVGLKLRTARSKARAQGLRVTQVSKRDGEADRVLAQEPAEGVEVSGDDEVRLVVGDGGKSKGGRA